MRYLPLLTLLFTYLTTLTTAAPAPLPASPIALQSTYLILNATVTQPWSPIQHNNPEHFVFSLVGDWAGSVPVTCSLHWNAGLASVTDEDVFTINVHAPAFACSDRGVTVDMTRVRVEPWFLWQVSVEAK